MKAARSVFVLVHSRRVPQAAVLVFALVLAGGCKKKQSAAAEPPASAAATPAAAHAAPASEYKEAHYNLTIEPKGSYKAGQPGQVQIVLVANAPFHCNDKYPYKFKVKDSSGVQYAEKVVRKDAVALEKHRATMSVGFTPASAGKKTIAGQFLFSVCSADKCLVQRRDLSLDVHVD